MPDPTYIGDVGNNAQCSIREKAASSGYDDYTTYGYKNFVEVRDPAGNAIHIIISTGTLAAAQLDASGTYNTAPLGSLLIHRTASAVALFLKEIASGAAAWTKVTTGAHGL